MERFGTSGKRRGAGNLVKRPRTGQAIAEGAAIFVVMAMVAAFLLFCLINTYLICAYNMRLQTVAAEGARRIVAQKWWLGMQRPEYNLEQAKRDAERTVNLELKAMGLPQASNFSYKSSTVFLRKKLTTVLRMDFDVSGLKIAQGLFFPPFLTLHASGVSSDAEHAVTRHGQGFIVVENSAGIQRGIRMPIYNATIGQNTAAHDRWLKASDEAIGDYPSAYLRVQCDSDGYINKQQDNKDEKGSEITDGAAWDSLPRE